MNAISKTRLYRIFTGIKERCYNPHCNNYKYYGGKGITICSEWLGEQGLQSFIEWALNNGYEEHLTIDRIDSSKPYSPDNCQWITQAENASRAHTKQGIISHAMTNTQKIKLALAYKNMSESELARQLGTSPQAFNQRMKTDKFSSEELSRIANILNAKYISNFEFPDGTVI